MTTETTSDKELPSIDIETDKTEDALKTDPEPEKESTETTVSAQDKTNPSFNIYRYNKNQLFEKALLAVTGLTALLSVLLSYGLFKLYAIEKDASDLFTDFNSMPDLSGLQTLINLHNLHAGLNLIFAILLVLVVFPAYKLNGLKHKLSLPYSTGLAGFLLFVVYYLYFNVVFKVLKAILKTVNTTDIDWFSLFGDFLGHAALIEKASQKHIEFALLIVIVSAVLLAASAYFQFKNLGNADVYSRLSSEEKKKISKIGLLIAGGIIILFTAYATVQYLTPNGEISINDVKADIKYTGVNKYATATATMQSSPVIVKEKNKAKTKEVLKTIKIKLNKEENIKNNDELVATVTYDEALAKKNKIKIIGNPTNKVKVKGLITEVRTYKEIPEKTKTEMNNIREKAVEDCFKNSTYGETKNMKQKFIGRYAYNYFEGEYMTYEFKVSDLYRVDYEKEKSLSDGEYETKTMYISINYSDFKGMGDNIDFEWSNKYYNNVPESKIILEWTANNYIKVNE